MLNKGLKNFFYLKVIIFILTIISLCPISKANRSTYRRTISNTRNRTRTNSTQKKRSARSTLTPPAPSLNKTLINKRSAKQTKANIPTRNPQEKITRNVNSGRPTKRSARSGVGFGITKSILAPESATRKLSRKTRNYNNLDAKCAMLAKKCKQYWNGVDFLGTQYVAPPEHINCQDTMQNCLIKNSPPETNCMNELYATADSICDPIRECTDAAALESSLRNTLSERGDFWVFGCEQFVYGIAEEYAADAKRAAEEFAAEERRKQNEEKIALQKAQQETIRTQEEEARKTAEKTAKLEKDKELAKIEAKKKADAELIDKQKQANLELQQEKYELEKKAKEEEQKNNPVTKIAAKLKSLNDAIQDASKYLGKGLEETEGTYYYDNNGCHYQEGSVESWEDNDDREYIDGDDIAKYFDKAIDKVKDSIDESKKLIDEAILTGTADVNNLTNSTNTVFNKAQQATGKINNIPEKKLYLNNYWNDSIQDDYDCDSDKEDNGDKDAPETSHKDYICTKKYVWNIIRPGGYEEYNSNEETVIDTACDTVYSAISEAQTMMNNARLLIGSLANSQNNNTGGGYYNFSCQVPSSNSYINNLRNSLHQLPSANNVSDFKYKAKSVLAYLNNKPNISLNSLDDKTGNDLYAAADLICIQLSSAVEQQINSTKKDD